MPKKSSSLGLFLVFLLMVSFFPHFLRAQPAGNALENIKKSGILTVAVPKNFPPFGFVEINMQLVGYDIDMARLVAQGLGVALKLEPAASAERIPWLTTGKVDLVIASLGKTAEREKVIDFSSAYAPFFSGVFGPGEIRVDQAEDLAGKTIGVTCGAVEDIALAEVAPQSAEIRRFEDNSATIAGYLSGQVQLLATGNVVAASVNDQNPHKLLEVKFLIKNSPCYIGVNKNQPDLLKAIDEIIAQAKKDGRLEAIAQKWLHATLPRGL